MPDNKKKTGKADDNKVAAGQKYEVAYAAKKAGAKPAAVKAAIAKVGNSRPKVMSELKKKR